MFKLSHALLQHLKPCILCQQYPAQAHDVCDACWHDLPWQPHQVQRHDITCQAQLAYAFPIAQVIAQYKNQQQLHYQHLLSSCLARYRPENFQHIQAIVPMPIAVEKLQQRGFDHIYLLAKALAKQWQLPLWQPVQRQASLQQRGLNRSERLDNLQGKFYIHQTDRHYKHVLMLDDVITTGASLSALAQHLQQLGCENIQALCLCDAAQK
ncbi:MULTISPECIES: ComF family protein [unclassified Acinetobacter]|uniref:ComF family protein n=1 Tax=unclassified Acinetobacter TaxID=196816 RepID=UPI0035B6FE0D